LSRLTYDTSLSGYRTDITEDHLRGAPAFTRDRSWDRGNCTITMARAITGSRVTSCWMRGLGLSDPVSGRHTSFEGPFECCAASPLPPCLVAAVAAQRHDNRARAECKALRVAKGFLARPLHPRRRNQMFLECLCERGSETLGTDNMKTLTSLLSATLLVAGIGAANAQGTSKQMDEQAGGNSQAVERNPGGSIGGSKMNPSPRSARRTARHHRSSRHHPS
jgi:hypothetical protein